MNAAASPVTITGATGTFRIATDDTGNLRRSARLLEPLSRHRWRRVGPRRDTGRHRLPVQNFRRLLLSTFRPHL